MAQRKSAKSSSKKRTARKKAKPQAAKASRRPAASQMPRNIKADIAGLVLIALGIFFMACLFQQDALGALRRQFASKRA